MLKGSIYQEDVTILNVYELNNGASNYLKQKLVEWRKNWQIYIIGGNFNPSLSVTDKQMNF